MSTCGERRELTRQARLRLGEVDRVRTEHRALTAQSELRLAESRLLLRRARAAMRLPVDAGASGVPGRSPAIAGVWRPFCSSGSSGRGTPSQSRGSA